MGVITTGFGIAGVVTTGVCIGAVTTGTGLGAVATGVGVGTITTVGVDLVLLSKPLTKKLALIFLAAAVAVLAVGSVHISLDCKEFTISCCDAFVKPETGGLSEY